MNQNLSLGAENFVSGILRSDFSAKIRNSEQIGGILVLRVAVDINIGEDASRHVLKMVTERLYTPLSTRKTRSKIKSGSFSLRRRCDLVPDFGHAEHPRIKCHQNPAESLRPGFDDTWWQTF